MNNVDYLIGSKSLANAMGRFPKLKEKLTTFADRVKAFLDDFADAGKKVILWLGKKPERVYQLIF